MKTSILFLATVALLLVGCVTGTPPPTFDGPLSGTAQAIELERYATRSAAEVSAAEAQAQATAQAAVYQATAVAAESQAEQERLRATEQAQSTATTIAVHQTAQAAAAQATATERAYQATATRQALDYAATATAQRKADDATTTRQALDHQATETRAAWEGRVTATAEVRTATAESHQATATRQAEQREEILGYGRDYGIPLVLLALSGGLVFLIVYGVRQMAKRPQVIQRDPRGDAPLLAIRKPDGEQDFIDLDRQPGHVTRMLPGGRMDAPQFRSAGQEERTTARDQVVDQATRPRLGSGARSGGRAPTLPMPAPPRAPAPGLRSVRVLRRLDQAGQTGLLPGPLLASLKADWEVEQ